MLYIAWPLFTGIFSLSVSASGNSVAFKKFTNSKKTREPGITSTTTQCGEVSTIVNCLTRP